MAQNPVKGTGSDGLAPLPVGATVDRYQLCQEIASGGMGRVYLARQRGVAGFEKMVALKTIHAELAEEGGFVEMFLDEARIASRIEHPNVCRVYDFGQSGGTYYLAMEYLLGESLSRVGRAMAKAPARRRGEDELLIARLVADAAEGLHAAHELTDDSGKSLRVVHRDVSPQNIFVTYDGGVRIVDFGIASAAGRLHQTNTGSLKGKFSYMAPEQMKREPVDRRTDIWALGVVLFELLTRRRLYRAANEIELMLAVLNDPVPRPSEVRPGLSPELEAVVLKALSKDRAQRYATAREMSRDLQRFIVGRGEVVGMAELGEWMVRLFPEERRAKREMLERARAMPEDAPLRVNLSGSSPSMHVAGSANAASKPASSAGDSTEPDMAAVGSEDPPPEVTRERALTTPARPASMAATNAADVPQRSARAITAGIVAALTIGTLGIWWLVAPRSTATVPDASTPARTPSALVPDASTLARTPSTLVPDASTLARTPSTLADTPSTLARTPSTLARTPSTLAGTASTLAPDASTLAGTPSTLARDASTPASSASAPAISPADRGPSRGTLVVSATSGWAAVYVDGQSVGRTPVTLPVAAGRHSIEMRPFGLMPMGGGHLRRSVTVGSGRTVRVRVPTAR